MVQVPYILLKSFTYFNVGSTVQQWTNEWILIGQIMYLKENKEKGFIYGFQTVRNVSNRATKIFKAFVNKQYLYIFKGCYVTSHLSIWVHYWLGSFLNIYIDEFVIIILSIIFTLNWSLWDFHIIFSNFWGII